MSELTIEPHNGVRFRRQLLSTASLAALIVLIGSSNGAHADGHDSSHPLFWIELGGDFAENQGDQAAFLPPFASSTPRPPFETVAPLEVEKVAPANWDGSAQLSFNPAGTPWTISVGVLYGKANRKRSLTQQTKNAMTLYAYNAYQVVTSDRSDSHTIVDFEVGKDVGLGILPGGTSTLSLGLRFAQFNSRSKISLISQPEDEFRNYYRFYSTLDAARNFKGVGPSLSWATSAPLIRGADSQISVDLGLNAAILFGHQTVRGHHQTTSVYHTYAFEHQTAYHNFVPLDRRRAVTVPNLGGFAGVSWKYPNAKISAGYRADFFFGAMDDGLDVARRDNRGFYGPFAAVSIGFP